ncbi:MAG: DUF3307 domain-containing protein [Firmicutes bacterium]|nr:DUF3307 domain-containing protein [Bacillota bacterium]
MFSFFVLLLAGHILADYLMQLNKFAQYKRKSLLVLGLHALIWALVISLILYWAGYFALWKFIFLFVSHYNIDRVKIKYFATSLPKWHPVNVTDQLLHILTILVTIVL